jgi:hypothetical protein
VAYKVDFHTHSVASPDGALTKDQYKDMLEQGKLDCIAVTDHNTIDMALELHAELGDKIIIGEEITTTQGDVIGLFLSEPVPAMLSLAEAIKHIKSQGGLVYVPHPFETVRKGISAQDLTPLVHDLDIIEIYNGRAVFQNRSADVLAWSEECGVLGAAGSDCHGINGWGRTYTLLEEIPTRGNLLDLLVTADLSHASPGLRGVLYPKVNRLHKKWSRRHA